MDSNIPMKILMCKTECNLQLKNLRIFRLSLCWSEDNKLRNTTRSIWAEWFKNIFQGIVELETDEKAKRTIPITHHGLSFNSDLNEGLGFTNKLYNVGTHLSQKSTNRTNSGRVHFKRLCVDGSVVNGRRESILI